MDGIDTCKYKSPLLHACIRPLALLSKFELFSFVIACADKNTEKQQTKILMITTFIINSRILLLKCSKFNVYIIAYKIQDLYPCGFNHAVVSRLQITSRRFDEVGGSTALHLGL